MGERHGRWVGHAHSELDMPPWGHALGWHTWMVAVPADGTDQPELGIVWSFLVMPRQPIRCYSAHAYTRSQTMYDLLVPSGDTEPEFDQVLELSPKLAWALADHPDPFTWFHALTTEQATR